MLTRARAKLAWRPARGVVIIALAILLALTLFFWHLGALPANLSPAEAAATKTSTIHDIYKNPVYAPWRVAQDIFSHINHSVFFLRLPSVIFSLIFLLAFYYALKSWFGKPIGFLSTVLLATTPLYILLSRGATPKVMNFMPILIIAVYLKLIKSNNTRLWWVIFFVVLATCLYVPGMVWLLVAGFLARRVKLMEKLQPDKSWFMVGLWLLLVVLISPIILACSRQPHLIKQFFLIPDHFGGILSSISNFGWMLLSLGLKTKQHETLIINRVPILDIGQIGLIVFGAYVMWSKLRVTFYWLAGLVLLICLAAGINNDFYVLAMALPFLAILVGMGLRYLYIEWMHVFPRNPLPRYFAIILMSALVLVHVMYGVRYGLVAWPHTVAVEHLYVIK